jgi:hypothetical protein
MAEFDRNLATLWGEYLDAGERAFRWDRLPESERTRLANDCQRLLATAYLLRSDLWMLRDTGAVSSDDYVVRAGNLGCVLKLVGDVYVDRGLLECACGVLYQAYQACDHNAHIMESLVRSLLMAGRFADAASVVNRANPKLIASEKDSTAQKLIHWACTNHQFACGLTPDLLKHCIELVARHSPRLGQTDVP